MTDLKMKVYNPLGPDYYVDSIASDMEHIGSRVAEGYIHQSLFWPEMAKSERRRRLRAEDRERRRLDLQDRRLYAAAWVPRVVEFMEGDT